MTIKHRKLIIGIAIIIFIVLFYVDLFIGPETITIKDLIQSITNPSGNYKELILNFIRFPRVIRSIIAGSSLALAGMILQLITKNPLAEPYMTGVASGSALFYILGILLSIDPSLMCLMSFAGALLTSWIVIFIAGINRFSLIKLILVGLSINIFISSIISGIMLFNPDKTHSMMAIIAGDTSNNLINTNLIFGLFITVIIIALHYLPLLNFISLDENITRSLSKNIDKYSTIFVLISALLTAISVSSVGILGFIGIIIPHIVRMLIGNNFIYAFILNILLGSSLVLFSDYLSRTLIYPVEIPIGIVIAVIGAPIFILILFFKGNKFYATT